MHREKQVIGGRKEAAPAVAMLVRTYVRLVRTYVRIVSGYLSQLVCAKCAKCAKTPYFISFFVVCK